MSSSTVTLATPQWERTETDPEEQQLPLTRSDFTYTACYCEENVYLLCRSLVARGIAQPDDLAVVFISNADRKIPLWCQKAGTSCGEADDSGSSGGTENGRREETGLVLWDYHVICLQLTPQPRSSGPSTRLQQPSSADPFRSPREWVVWDLDTTLPFPATAMEYTRRALWAGRPYMLDLQETYQRLFRVISAPNFFRLFASDRSHMRHSVTQDWLAKPPSYPCLVAQDGVTNRLETYVQMEPRDATNISLRPEYTSLSGVPRGPNLNPVACKAVLARDDFGVVLDEPQLCSLLGVL
eukprot:TRINITY_DN4030_c0_g1_i2.p1 TRINITY_DN4030_c0_g1~~TRINITY_DN4030_c0_g1_i2.p1  ORF type:complete len:297 (-),score=-5.75 TRINITY_DN4030_c0_g1_i2:179-1069(-)